MNKQSIFTLFLAVLSTALGIYAFKMYRQNKQNLESKNMYSEWNSNQDVLNTLWLNNNKLAQQAIDKNFDYNFEILINYSTYGKPIQKNFDSNENGIYEKTEIYNFNGELVGICMDSDEDGALDEFTLYFNNGNKIKFLDKNFDGKYEFLEISNSNETKNLKTEELFNLSIYTNN